MPDPAIKTQLAVPAKTEDSTELNQRLADAVKLRDEHSGNVYRRLDQIRRQLMVLGAVALVALLALLTTSAIPTTGGREPLRYLGVALFGGAFSGAISVIRAADATHPVPEGLITERPSRQGE